MNSIVGHQKILTYFEKVITAGNLSHAYCFVGQSGSGKHTVAKAISAKLFKVAPEKLSTQPDFIEISQATDEKTGKTKKDISIEQLRDCQSFFAEYSFLGGYKIIIIDPADQMSLSASNGLLKTLEEPRQHTLLFLLATDETKLPETIRSRCQMIYFSPVPVVEIQAVLINRGVDEKKATEMAVLSRGLPGVALSWAESEEMYDEYKQEIKRFESLSGSPFYDKLKKVEELFGDKKDHIVARQKLQNILALWQKIVRDWLLSNQEKPAYPTHHLPIKKPVDSLKLLEIERRIFIAREQLDQNVHPRLLVEHILLSIP